MSGWIVRWKPPYSRPDWPPLESTVYASESAAQEWAAFVRRRGGIEIEVIDLAASGLGSQT